ncbi:response regulator [bacterium]|nr:response regulator [bacterium]
MAYKILLADDSVTIQKVVELTFAESDYLVTSVSDGISALKKIKEIMPDVVLLDVFMPQMDGYQVCQKIKSDPVMKDIPVLLLTGTFESFDEEKADQVMADGYLTKPFESTELITQVENLARKRVAADAEGQSGSSVPKPPSETADIDFEDMSAEETAPEQTSLASDDNAEEPLFEADEADEVMEAEIAEEDEEISNVSSAEHEPVFDTGEESEFLTEEEKIFGADEDDDLAIAKDTAESDEDLLWEVSEEEKDGEDEDLFEESSSEDEDISVQAGPGQEVDQLFAEEQTTKSEEDLEDIWEEPLESTDSVEIGGEDSSRDTISFDDGTDSDDALWSESDLEHTSESAKSDFESADEETPPDSLSTAEDDFERPELSESSGVTFADSPETTDEVQPDSFEESPDISAEEPSISTPPDVEEPISYSEAQGGFEDDLKAEPLSVMTDSPLSTDLDIEEELEPDQTEAETEDEPEIEASESVEETAPVGMTAHQTVHQRPLTSSPLSPDDFQKMVADQLELLLSAHLNTITEQVADKLSLKLGRTVAESIVTKLGIGTVPDKAKTLIEEIAWEVVPDLAQVIIQKEIENIKAKMN